MEGFNAISLKLKEMYQVWESSLCFFELHVMFTFEVLFTDLGS